MKLNSGGWWANFEIWTPDPGKEVDPGEEFKDVKEVEDIECALVRFWMGAITRGLRNRNTRRLGFGTFVKM